MVTVKVALTMPESLVGEVDTARKEKDISRSGYITQLVKKAMEEEKSVRLKRAYNKVFSDPEIVKEQQDTARHLERSGNEKGQKW